MLTLLPLLSPIYAQDPPADPAAEPAAAAAPAEDAAPAGPVDVHVGAHINDIQVIDLATHSYVVDLYLWFRWKGELDPATSMEFINPYELWGHMSTPNYEEPEELPSGERYQVLRVQGGFSKKLPLYDYPFDRQELLVAFEDSVSSTSGLRYISDGVTMNADLTLPGFVVEPPRLDIGDYKHPTTFGDPRETDASTFSRASIALPIHRPAFPYAIKLLLPVICATVSASLKFMFSPDKVDTRSGIGITALLTVVALQITFNEDLPDVGYLTLMDKLYVCSYLLIIAGLGELVWATRLAERGETDRANRLDRISLVAFLSLFLVAVVVLVRGALTP